MFGRSNDNSLQYALIYQSELDLVSRWVLDYPDIETGGDFFGFWTHRGNPVVQFAIGPGPNVNRTYTFFNQDVDYLIECGRELRKHHGLLHMGEWHSHHRLGLKHPSAHDCDTVSSCIDEAGLPRFLLTICTIDSRNDTLLNGFLFDRGVTGFQPLAWVVLPGISPVRSHMEQASTIHRSPIADAPSLAQLATVSLDQPLAIRERARFAPGSWTDSPEGQLALKSIHDRFEERYGKSDLSLEDDGRVSLVCNSDNIQARIVFPHQFPDETVELVLTDSSTGRSIIGLNGLEENWENTPHEQRLDLVDQALEKVVNEVNKLNM